MQGRFTMLGSGASTGVPVIGCRCGVCLSTHPRNARTRPSGLIEMGDKVFLIDVGPDFRDQALKHKIERLDALLLTHTHYDHIAGIDELRIYYFLQRRPLPCILSEESFGELQTRYHYLFAPQMHASNFTAQLDFRTLPQDRGCYEFEGHSFHYFAYFQGPMKVHGFRFGNFAYVSDICQYPDSIFDDLKGVDTLILSALRFTPSPVHLSMDEAVDFVDRVGASQTWLTHLGHEVEYEKANAYLPSHVRLGYDGLQISFP